MQKKIEFEQGNLIIGYFDNLQDISVYVVNNLLNPSKLVLFQKLK
jgi:hypothetical protein